MHRHHSVLVVMARYPAIGAVKTRLATAVGGQRACALYRAFLRDIDTRFANRARPLVWAFYPADRNFAALVTPGPRCIPQRGASLGQRMHHCFRQLYGDGFERVIMIGSDMPHIRDEWIDAAEERLDDVDVVLGPSVDGGYYLIAMRAPHDVFTGVAMSTPRVLAQTRAIATAAGLRVHLLPESFDIDAEADVARLRELLARGVARRLPATASVLKEWSRRVKSQR